MTIIIPAFNEEEGIGLTLERLSVASSELPPYEVIVIDDGSTDKTSAVASAKGARVIHHPYNLGMGAAIKSGIRAVTTPFLVFIDADGQHDPLDIGRLFPELDRYNMVIGARTKDSDSSLHRSMANKLYNRFASLLCDFPIEDLTSGFRLLRREDAQQFCEMLPNTFSAWTTSTIAFLRTGRFIKYVPVRVEHRKGKSKISLFRDGFEFLIIILKVTMTYSPLRVFIPLSSFLFFLGIGRWVLFNLSGVGCFLTAIGVFALGLIAEQISLLRFEKLGTREFSSRTSEQLLRGPSDEE